MKRKLLFILITTLSISCYAQINFEKGYFITSSNEKTECFIRNVDWLYNPTEFEYRLSEDGERKTGNINTVKEFGIYNESKFIRRIVNIDTSSEELDKMSGIKNPIYKKQKLFLKVLVEGEADLYFYENKRLIKYFFSLKKSDIKQLIFKSYINDNGKVAKNNRYRQQLWNNLKCSNFLMSNINEIDYVKKDLTNFFIKYNECSGSEYTNYKRGTKKGVFSLVIRPGLNSSSLDISRSGGFTTVSENNFKNKLSYRLGVEAELIMPFNKNKWAIIIEPTYQYFNSEIEVLRTSGFGNQTVDINYRFIDIPIGIRHYMFLNENSKIFINGSYVLNFTNDKSFIKTDPGLDFLDLKPNSNFAFGIGYKYKKYSLEFNYQTPRNLLRQYVFWNAKYTALSIIFGYSIL